MTDKPILRNNYKLNYSMLHKHLTYIRDTANLECELARYRGDKQGSYRLIYMKANRALSELIKNG